MTLAQRLLAVHAALEEATVPHAFGGAIALAYWTEEPRGTRDLDVNIFLDARQAEHVLGALPDAVQWNADDVSRARRDEQLRVWYDEVPLDLFFAYAPIHAMAAAHRRLVPFARNEIPVLGPDELAVFKAMFDRTKDWADIEAMVAAGTVNGPAVRRALAPMLAPDDHRWARLEEAESRARR